MSIKLNENEFSSVVFSRTLPFLNYLATSMFASEFVSLPSCGCNEKYSPEILTTEGKTTRARRTHKAHAQNKARVHVPHKHPHLIIIALLPIAVPQLESSNIDH